MQNGRFPCKIALCLKKACCYKVSLCENCQQQSCRAFIGLSIIVKMTGGGRPLLRENLANTDPPPLHNADFRSIFARSASTVTASEKSSINTNRKSTTRFPISLKRIVCVDPKPRSKTQKMSKFKQSAITSKRYEIGCQLLLITNKMSHTVFRLLTTSVILNDLERRNSPYFILFHRIR